MSMLRGSGVALYNITLSTATAIHHACYGNFSAARQQEIVVSRGKVLQLLRPNQNGQVQVVASIEVRPFPALLHSLCQPPPITAPHACANHV